MRVLAIDLDHQGNMTRPLAKSGKAEVASITANQVLTETGLALDEDGPFVLVPGTAELRLLERQPQRHNAFAVNLRAFMRAASERASGLTCA